MKHPVSRRADANLRKAPLFPVLARVSGGLMMAFLVTSAFAQYPLLPPAEDSFHETPPKRVFDLNPAATKLPAAPDRSARVSALEQKVAPLIVPSWTWLGPAAVPNGQTEDRVDPVSGRVTAIAVHPTNPQIAYVGAAQGGLYRTLDGGATWTQLMDNAPATLLGTPLAIGAVTLDPTNPHTVLVGTGEGNNSIDSFIGSGLYIITAADTANPILHGPYNLRASDNADIFTARAINSIVVDPANHNNIFVATSAGASGIVYSSYPLLPPRGLYRSTNAFAGVDATGTPKFSFLTLAAGETNDGITSAVMDPSNGNTVLCAISSQIGASTGGIYRSTNALAPTPTFTKVLGLPDFGNAKLAINKVGATVTVYAVSDEGSPDNGRLYKSTDGGATFGAALTAANGFAGGNGWYNLVVAVDPTDANNVYIAGSINSTGPGGIFEYSNDGGAHFTSSVTGLHADTHALAVAPSSPATIYHGNDGGVWRSTDGGHNWTSLNTATFSATQFQGLSVHPTDSVFTIGGTQDNGTQFLMPNHTFTRADFGDGGYTLIDQNTTDTTAVTMYHTYFNASGSIIGTARVLQSTCASDGEWSFHGAGTGFGGPFCDGSVNTNNGININDDVNFYAPQALGPGNPNTWYFGTSRLYRSTNRADSATAVSQVLETNGAPISAIAVAAQDDTVRMVGLNDGRVFATTQGQTTLQQVAGFGATFGTPGTPGFGVGRIAIDPNNRAVAYVCFTGFGTPASPIAHVWKTTNLDALNNVCGASTVTFTPVSSGLPDIPVNAIAIDPVTLSGTQSTDVYVGTDAGVYYSHDGGTSWSAYGSGLPHAAVFGLEIQNKARLVRAATHGRGLYEVAAVSSVLPTPTPTPAPPAGTAVYGELITPSPCSPNLTSSTVTFTWSAGNATAYILTIGDSRVAEPGGSNLFNSNQTGGLSATVRNLPTDGRPLYVRLWSRVNGVWYNPPKDYTFFAVATNVQTPLFAPAAGTYHKQVTVNIASGTPGATIHYTIDGTTPTAASPVFTHTFVLTQTKTVRAIATKTGVPNSPVASATYTVLKN